MGSISRDSTFDFAFSYICTKEDPRIGNKMDFTPEDDNEVIREAVSKKLYIPLFNPSKKVWRESTQTKASTSPFHIHYSLRYTNEGYNNIVDLVDTNKNYPDSIKYIIKFLGENAMVVTEKFLKSRNVPDIVSIPISLEDYINE